MPCCKRHRKLLKFFLAITSIFFLSSCNNSEEKLPENPSPSIEEAVANQYDLNRLNYMRLKEGKFIRPAVKKPYPSTDSVDLSKTFSALGKANQGIVIYFHGGMIPLKKAFRDPKKIGLDDSIRKASMFPFYVFYGANPMEIWHNRNGMLDGYSKEEIFEGEEDEQGINPLDSLLMATYENKSFVYLQYKGVEKYLQVQGFRDTGYRSMTDTARLIDKFERLVAQTNESFRKTIPNPMKPKSRSVFVDSLYADKSFQQLAEKDLLKNPGLVPQKGKAAIQALYNLDSIFLAVDKRFHKKRDHGLVMTVTEETICRSPAWFCETLREWARNGWKQQKLSVSTPFKNPSSQYGGTALLDHLVKINDSLSQLGKSQKIYLMGSSTGTIMLCEMLLKSADPKYRRLHFNVILSVPSCTMELFAKALKVSGDRIDSLSMFTLSNGDDMNSSGWLLRNRYPGSILFFVSSICETDNNPYHDLPLVGLQRFYLGKFENDTTLRSEDRKDILYVKKRFALESNARSRNIAWSNQRSGNPYLENDAGSHKGVIRSKKVQHSIKWLLSK